MFEKEQLKRDIDSYKKIVSAQDKEIMQLQKIIDIYHNKQKDWEPKWWQSPFMDVLYFVGGFVVGVILITTIVR